MRWLHKPWFVRVQADPCLLEHDGRLYLYYEELLVGSVKGRLRWTELTATGPLPRRGASMISLREHAAYPYVFEHAGAFYCVPETGQGEPGGALCQRYAPGAVVETLGAPRRGRGPGQHRLPFR